MLKESKEEYQMLKTLIEIKTSDSPEYARLAEENY
jgi:hypothetical protein